MFVFLFGNMISVELCPDILLKQKIFLFGGEYIAAVEQTCLTQGKADEMRAEIKAAIKKSHPLDPTSLGRNREHSES